MCVLWRDVSQKHLEGAAISGAVVLDGSTQEETSFKIAIPSALTEGMVNVAMIKGVYRASFDYTAVSAHAGTPSAGSPNPNTAKMSTPSAISISVTDMPPFPADAILEVDGMNNMPMT